MGDERLLAVVGKRISEKRRSLGYSQEKLSEICGIDRSFIGKVERGQVNVSLLTLGEIARALKVNVKYFFMYDERTI